MGKLKITQVRSRIGRAQRQRKVLDALGLTRIGRSVVLDDTPSTRGMVAKVRHLVEVEPVKEVRHEAQ